MPPKRKSPAAAAAAAPAASPRKTRSMAAGKRGADAPAKTAKKEEEAVLPAAAPAEQKGRKKAKREEEAVLSAPPAAQHKGRKKVKKEEEAAEQKGRKKAKMEAAMEAVEEDGGAVVQNGKRVIVEACTQCQQFKKRALKVKEDLESAVPGVSVIINPEKPRRGCLEIREEGGKVFISLLNMPRPFTAMKKLDMDEIIKDIAKKIS